MEKQIVRRRGLLKAGVAASALALTPCGLRAQAKIAPPNIIKAGTLVMSINPTLPPLQFVDDKGQLQGMRVELANECAKRMGLTPEYIRTEFATMIPGLAAKRWDMINTGIFFTEERSKLMYMVPYEQAAISFLAAKGNPLGLKTVDDLAGKKIARSSASTPEYLLSRFFTLYGLSLQNTTILNMKPQEEMDAIIVFSACPQDMLPINNGITNEARFAFIVHARCLARRGAGLRDRVREFAPAVGRRDDLVTRPDAEGLQGEEDAVRGVIHADAVRRTAVRRELGLELFSAVA